MTVYRRPFDYAARSAIVYWQPSPEWQVPLLMEEIRLQAYPWTIGVSPTIDMDAAALTFTAPAWSVAVGKFVDMGATAITFTAPDWGISYTQEVGVVPDVVGLDQTAAVSSVRSAGLTPLVVYSVTGSVDPQKVTAQSPAAATVVALSSPVTITAEAGVYAWPSAVVPMEAEWKWHTRSRPSISPLTGKTRTVSDGGSHWSCTLTVRHLKDEGRALMQAFLSRLRGRLNRAQLPSAVFTKQGTLTALTVNGADQSGTSLVCDGATPTTGTAKAGDMISIAGHLYMVVADATAVAGAVTLEVVPPLEGPPADDLAVNLNPSGYFRLAGNTVGWSNAPGGFTSFESIEFIEDRS